MRRSARILYPLCNEKEHERHLRKLAAAQLLARREHTDRDPTTGGSGRMPSMLSFIAGPSRIGDIERILVLGAPKELILILVG